MRLLLLFLALLALPARGAGGGAPALELEVDLDPGSRLLRVVAQVTPAAGDFHFALHESLQVRAASAGGRPVAVTPAGREGPLRGWRAVLPPGAQTLRLEYAGTLPRLDRDLDHRGVLGPLPPMAGAEGSFLPAGSGWYPEPAPLFAYRVSLTVPAGQRALVPGSLVSETASDAGGAYRARFEYPQPAQGIDLMAGPWVVREQQVPRQGAAPLRLRTWFFPELDATPGLAEGYLEDTRRYIERYSREIGPYPFDAFSVVASPLPTGFGMPTLTYLGADVLRLPFIRATSLGHEVLHNWWGNGVYVDYAAGNWSEGLTTFMADYAYKEQASADAAREMRLAWLRDFAAVPGGGESLADFRSRTHGAAAAVGYGKAAMVFVMLRDMIGEAAFRAGIRGFWQQQRFRSAGWDDLRAAFEAASGRSLEGFFRQWLERPGGPAVKLAAARTEPRPGGMRLHLELEQSAPAYALSLPLEIVYPDRSEIRRVDATALQDTVALDVDARPTGVRLDPDLRLWRVLEREQLPPILRQWIVARAPRLALASPQLRDAAEALAQRLFEKAPTPLPPTQLGQGSAPVLLVGLHEDVAAALGRAGLPADPLGERGTARVWTVSGAQGPPLAVVSARDAEALMALLRPLPHYGGQSWLVFEGSRAVARGVWPAPGRLIPVQGGERSL